jgi:hypothetical protein
MTLTVKKLGKKYPPSDHLFFKGEDGGPKSIVFCANKIKIQLGKE